jgi:hypothetical protein
MRNRSSRIALALCFVLALLARAGKAAGDLVTSQGLLAAALGETDRIVDPHAKAQMLNLIANTLAQNGDIAGAKVTASAIPASEAGWKYDTLGMIAGAEAGSGDTPTAATIIDQIPDPYKGSAYEYVAEALAKTGDLGDAGQYAQQADGIYQTRANAAVAKAIATSGDLDTAIGMAKKLDDASEQVKVFAFIYGIQMQDGRVSDARQTMELAQEALGAIPQYVLKVPLGALARQEVKAGDLAGANALSKFDASYVSREIALEQIQEGDLNAAKTTFAQVSDAADKAFVAASMAENEVKIRDVAAATQWFKTARTAALSSDEPAAFARVAEVWAKIGNPRLAVGWALTLKDPVFIARCLLSESKALNKSIVASSD